MKKTLLLVMLVVALVALTAAPAMAGGWWDLSGNLWSTASGAYADGGVNGFQWGGDLIGDDLLSAMVGVRSNLNKTDGWGTRTGYYGASDGNPHGGFATTTNYCKSCHAVHEAGASSYRLLKNGGAGTPQPGIEDRSSGEGLTSGAGSLRSNECMYCHDATSGATQFRPYSLGVVATVRGEHTIGATVIPDSNATTLNRDPLVASPSFGCYDCHSVHGANVMAFWDAGLILRDDPNNDGTKVTDTRARFASLSDTDSITNEADMQRNNFCADCHDANASWDADGNDATRSNPGSHVTGPDADGQLEVYGTTQTVAIAGNKSIQDRGCRGCHASNDHGADPNTWGTVSAWPHQTLESKMVTQKSGVYNGEDPSDVNRAGIIAGYSDTNRSLYRMDAVCLRCHSADGLGGGAWGVGNTF